MEFQDRLDKIWTRISDDDFLANRGVANEVRYYVFDYEPCDELIMRQKIESLKKQNNLEADGFEIVEYDETEDSIFVTFEDDCVQELSENGIDDVLVVMDALIYIKEYNLKDEE